MSIGASRQRLEFFVARQGGADSNDFFAIPVDPYLNAVVAFARLARAGVGTVVHVHSSIIVDKLLSDAEAVARAANAVGIRLAFVVPLVRLLST